MGAFRDLTNQRFGKLTVVQKTTERDNSGGVIWNCQCDCGNYIKVPSRYLLHGGTKSCGCLDRDLSVESRKRDLIGMRFGRLTVLEKTERRYHGSVVWKCQCDCGNIHYTYTDVLINGACQSCGCFRKEQAHNANFKDITGNSFW